MRDFVVALVGESDPDFYFELITDETRPMEIEIEDYEE